MDEAGGQSSLFDAGGGTEDDEIVAAAYKHADRTLDDLPYTPEFDQVHATVTSAGLSLSKRDLFHRLHNMRKGSRLPRLGRAAQGPPRLDPEHDAALTGLVEQAIGRLSLRDRLPYTPEFDALVVRFNDQTQLGLSPHDVWRVIAKLAK